MLTTLLSNYYHVEPKPIWITEVGTNVGGTTENEFPGRTLAAIADDGTPAECEFVFWFCWSDGMVNGFGLVSAGTQPTMKPSYFSYQKFARSQV